MGNNKTILNHCLYFTTNSLSRIITRMADEEFKETGLSPSHAFAMMMVNNNQGIGPKKLSEELHLAPSTVTRFIDLLVNRGYLVRRSDGKNSKIYSTSQGKKLQKVIDESWNKLHKRYSKMLGKKWSDDLTKLINTAASKLED